MFFYEVICFSLGLIELTLVTVNLLHSSHFYSLLELLANGKRNLLFLGLKPYFLIQYYLCNYQSIFLQFSFEEENLLLIYEVRFHIKLKNTVGVQE